MINNNANYVIGQLNFQEKGPSRSGDLIIGNFKDGNWSYVNKNDSFEIHYEVEIKNPDKVKFHVEAPTKNNNTTLNLIKQFMITSITADILLKQSSQILMNLETLLSSGCKLGGQNDSYNYSNNTINLTPNNIETNCSTTVFSIVVPSPSTPELKMERVHKQISHLIDKFIFPFIQILRII